MNDREVAEKLWELLDDIDNAIDVFKPNMIGFEGYVANMVAKRKDYITSDGHNLVWDGAKMNDAEPGTGSITIEDLLIKDVTIRYKIEPTKHRRIII